jgi:hypothetical protein
MRRRKEEEEEERRRRRRKGNEEGKERRGEGFMPAKLLVSKRVIGIGGNIPIGLQTQAHSR